MNEQLKIKRVEARAVMTHDQIELLKEVMRNPVIELIGAAAILNYMTRSQNQFFAGFNNAAAMTAITTVVGFQQLAPSLPTLAAAAPGLVSGLLTKGG